MKIIFITHIVTSLYMAGLCWFVQIVHYPLFREIHVKDFPRYERKNFVTGFVTVPVMTVELATGLWLLYQYPSSTLYIANTVLLGVIALSTCIFQVPIHLKLSHKATNQLITKLIRTNWIRTLSWTLRVGILASLLSQSIHM